MIRNSTRRITMYKFNYTLKTRDDLEYFHFNLDKVIVDIKHYEEYNPCLSSETISKLYPESINGVKLKDVLEKEEILFFHRAWAFLFAFPEEIRCNLYVNKNVHSYPEFV